MRLLCYLALILIFSCKTKQHSTTVSIDFVPDFSKGPATIVYKAGKEYHKLVPVLLSEDKSRIIGYPAKSDIQNGETLPYPIILNDGYFLDNRGISKNSAFLDLTYEQYLKLDSLPSVKEMYKWISNKDPLISIYDCGSRKVITDVENQLNALIDQNRLKELCRVVK